MTEFFNYPFNKSFLELISQWPEKRKRAEGSTYKRAIRDTHLLQPWID